MFRVGAYQIVVFAPKSPKEDFWFSSYCQKFSFITVVGAINAIFFCDNLNGEALNEVKCTL